MERISIVDPTSLSRALAVLQKGGVIVYPTETAYGLGADATNPEAVRTVCDIKARDDGKPVPIIVGDAKQARQYVFFTPEAEVLIEAFWPGPLTLILAALDGAFAQTLRAEDDVALRASGLEWCRELALALDRPITSTSANASGKPTEYSIDGVYKSLGHTAEFVDLWVDGGTLRNGPVSTIVRLVNGVEIRREGAVSGEEIRKLLK